MIAEWEPTEHSAGAVADTRSQAWGWFGAVVIGVAILLMAFSAGAKWIESSRWDPLGDYPLQTVFSGVDLPQDVNPSTTLAGSSTGTGPPVFYIDEEISVFGTKCVKRGEGVKLEDLPTTTTTEPTTTAPGATTTTPPEPVLGTVQVRGTLSWVSDNPPGRIIAVGRGGGARGPGCVSSTFRNPIPEEVLVEIERLAAQGITQSDWHLTGTEVPVRTVDGVEEEGVSRTWTSTTFRVLSTEAP